MQAYFLPTELKKNLFSMLHKYCATYNASSCCWSVILHLNHSGYNHSGVNTVNQKQFPNHATAITGILQQMWIIFLWELTVSWCSCMKYNSRPSQRHLHLWGAQHLKPAAFQDWGQTNCLSMFCIGTEPAAVTRQHFVRWSLSSDILLIYCLTYD